MRATRQVSESRQAAALAFFAEIARLGAGYRVRGQRGWAHHDDVQLGTRVFRCSDVCEALFRRELLVRELASAPGAAVPAYVYRATEAGVTAHAGHSGAPAVRLPRRRGPGAERAVYVPSEGRWVLEALRNGYAHGVGRGRVDGESGWLTAAEIRKALDEWNQTFGRPWRYRTFDSPTLAALVDADLIERRPVRVPWRENRPLCVYRVTPHGRTAALLEWAGPECDDAAEWDLLRSAAASYGRALVLGRP